jgi:hypothetical protein
MLSATALRRPRCYFQDHSRDQSSARVKWEFAERDRETVVFSDQGTSRTFKDKNKRTLHFHPLPGRCNRSPSAAMRATEAAFRNDCVVGVIKR